MVIFPTNIHRWRPRGMGEHLIVSDYDIKLRYEEALEEVEEVEEGN